MTVPECFISYAWGNAEHESWVLGLRDDLQKADVDVILDQLDNARIGSSVERFISRIDQSKFILVVGTPTYLQKYENKVSPYGSVVAAEVDLIGLRLVSTEGKKATVLPLLLAGDVHTSFPPLLKGRVHANFTSEEHYFVELFNLVLTIHNIPFDNLVVRDLRANLRKEAQAFINRS